MEKDKLISIIMPTYNVEKYIEKTITSVQNQTYKNWELLIVDDYSNDKTINIIKNKQNLDSKIKLITLTKNMGAAFARNTAIKEAKGEYIAFLDSDDLWNADKLEVQIAFMEKEKIDFSSTNYNKIDENGEDLNKVIKLPYKLNYWQLLKTCPGNSTVIYNAKKIGKTYSPNIKKRNDYTMWLSVIKKTDSLYNLNITLGSHRIRNGSISKNKFSLVKYHWIVYRKYEKLSLLKSLNLVLFWIFSTLKKRNG